MGDTMVLCSAVVAGMREGMDFFPLTVEYREKFAAAGKIPGGFIKREGRPSDKEILSARLVDRCLRPNFPDGFRNEVQVICYVISADGENDSDVLAGIGASSALFLTGAPFDGPVGEVRVGRVDGELIINPTRSNLERSDINLIVAGKADSVVMVEGEMGEISEDEMTEAIKFGHQAVQQICEAQQALRQAYVGEPEPIEYEDTSTPPALVEQVRALIADEILAHLHKPYEKQSFYKGISDIKAATLDRLLGADDEEAGTVRAEVTPDGYTVGQIKGAVAVVEKDVMREMILSEKLRLDGRGPRDIRPIWSEVGYLPRAHGSALFTRGETQVLASVTFGTDREMQAVDQIFDDEDKRFYLHYDFPPFCTGEAKPIRGTSRREVGHGYLAERALKGVMPNTEEFPYTIRITSEVLESNGSSSMATVCGGTLALMDAGVPVKKPVAGIAMGLIVDGDRYAILSDILGTEDHLGDMDFKVTGTRDGITGCQMDIKVAGGLSYEVLAEALVQAQAGRYHILDKMAETLDAPRDTMSPYAPRLVSLEIDSEFIGAIIGPGGKVIQGMQRETNTSINIDERDGKGFVTIAGVDEAGVQQAIDQIKIIISVPEEGEDYEGNVVSVLPFGAVIEIMPGKEGLLHVTELDYKYVESVEDYVKPGDTIKVRLIEIRDGKLRLSRKPFIEKPEGYVERERSGGRSGGGDRRGGGGGGSRGGGDRRGGDRRGGGGGGSRGGGDRRGGGGGDRRR
jgi:polyribonucleotide nucleotidyltransferase